MKHDFPQMAVEGAAISERYERLFAEMADKIADDPAATRELFNLSMAIAFCEPHELGRLLDGAGTIIHTSANVGVFNLMNQVIQRLADKERSNDNG